MAHLITSRRVVVLVLALAAAIAGGLLLARDQPARAAAGKTLRLSADPTGKPKFSTTKLTATHGKVTIMMMNPSGSGSPHGIAVQGKGIDKDGKIAGPGRTSTVSATLKKGTYSFYCPVDGHKAAGMKGTLTVK
jgi:uncharacterized cupredoxin-like copper-binding protein